MTTAPDQEHVVNELAFTRIINAPRENIFRCWTEPELLKPWFCPKPWGVSHAEIDARTGGASYIVMNGPNGEVVPNHGVYLEIIPNQRIVFTNAFFGGWLPQPQSNPGFMFVGIINLEDAGNGRTKYTASVRHWNQADCESHKNMGFYEGWGVATDQLEVAAQAL